MPSYRGEEDVQLITALSAGTWECQIPDNCLSVHLRQVPSGVRFLVYGCLGFCFLALTLASASPATGGNHRLFINYQSEIEAKLPSPQPCLLSPPLSFSLASSLSSSSVLSERLNFPILPYSTLLSDIKTISACHLIFLFII